VECVIAKAKLLQDHLFSKGVGEEEMNGEQGHLGECSFIEHNDFIQKGKMQSWLTKHGQILKFLNLERLKEGDITSFGFIPNGRCKVCQQNGSSSSPL
jgi:hypothetical protein